MLSLILSAISASNVRVDFGKSNVTIVTDDVYAAGLEPPEEVSDEVAMISFSDDEPIEGEICIINATVFNIGTRSADVTVYFYDGAPVEGDLIGKEDITINPLGHKIASTDWDTTGEDEFHTIHVLINPDDPENETDDSNNQAQKDIVVNQIPKASAGNDLAGKEDDIILFDGSSSSDTPSDLSAGLEYFWDFSDSFGNESNPSTVSGINLTAPTHRFTHSGIYQINLSVSDDGEAYSHDSVMVSISNVVPTAKASMNKRKYIEDEEVIFDSSETIDTPSDKASLRYFWDFDDGTDTGWINDTVINHTYSKAKTYYNVTLTVKDNDDEVSSEVLGVLVENVPPVAKFETEFSSNGNVITFNASTTTDTLSDFKTLDYKWDFGDGVYSDEIVATHTFEWKKTYTVTLTVTDDDGDSSNSSTDITIKNLQPMAFVGTYDRVYDEDELIKFMGSESEDPDGEIVLYKWYFGDGTNATGNTTEHSYLKAGVYKIFLAVTDDDGAENIDMKELTIRNLVPEADAGFDIEIYEGDTASFDAGRSNDTPSDKKLLEYDWDFGDNYFGTGKLIEHIYEHAGEYEVTLTVTDDDGEFSIDRLRVIVLVGDYKLSSIELTLNIDPATTGSRGSVFVAGSVSYEFVDRIPDNDVSLAVLRVEIVETGDYWYIVPDIYGKYEEKIEAPEEEGTYTVRATISRLGLLAEDTEMLKVVKTQNAKPETKANALSVSTVAVAVGTLAAVGSTGAFFAGTDLGRYKFFGLMVPLYSKLNKSAILDNFTRGRIYEHIRMNPGQHYSGIKDMLELNNGCLTYHLKVLMRSDLIQAHTDGTHKRFYPVGMRVDKGRPSNIQDHIYQIINERSYISQREIADEIGIDISTVNYHVNIMVGAGIIQSEKSGKIKKYCVMHDQ
jgi:PKD repeat protein